jgi:antitoxin CptB
VTGANSLLRNAGRKFSGFRYSPSSADAARATVYIDAQAAPTRSMTHLPDPRRKRLLFRSWHRGTRETDLVLGSFAEAHVARFDSDQLDRFEALLECPDADLFDWITGRAAPFPEHDNDVTRLLLSFRYRPRPT